MKDTFALPQGPYLLSHSVGRPLTTAQHAFNEAFFAPWQQGQQEPWSQWLQAIEQFTQALARLFNSSAGQFCPQVNLSSALTKALRPSAPAHRQPRRAGRRPLFRFARGVAVGKNVGLVRARHVLAPELAHLLLI